MKKIFLLAAVAIGAISANAQTAIDGSKFFDNWSIGLKGGVATPLDGHNGYGSDARPTVGVEIRKQITPVFGLGVEGEAGINTSTWSFTHSSTWEPIHSSNAFDNSYVGAFGTVNMMNLFAGYNGTPRVFEIEAVAGAGWLHSYYPKSQGEDGNSFGTKVGLNFNFNLGESKAWTISLKPAIVWNMNYAARMTTMGANSTYNVNHAVAQIDAAITYHFENSNGTHSFKSVVPMDEAYVAAINAEVNNLRAQVNQASATNAALQTQVAELENQLQASISRPTTIVEQVVNDLDNVTYVFFNQASSQILPTQQANVEMLAQTLINNPGSTVVIKGYASPEGNWEFNQKLAQARADVVKNLLVNRYNISADRITAQGEGVGNVFAEPTWNRVAISVVNPN